MISATQIKAARAILDWSQKELASRTQLTQVTIANIELGNSGSRTSLDKIQSTLEGQGIEFISNGVRHKDHYLVNLVGNDAYLRLLDDVFFTLRDTKGDVLFNGADERKNFPGVEACIRKIKGAGIRTRVLIEEGNNYILGDLNDYRQIPKEYFSNAVTVVYGSKYAIFILHATGPRVHVVNNLDVADAQRKIFDFLWDRGTTPKKSEVHARY